jgi:hypothetical protein
VSEPLTPAQVASQIHRAVVTDLDTGQVSQLTMMPGSACLFRERFKVGSYLVQLRLDWSDLDGHGHPRLDADFLIPATKQHDRSMRRHPAHHTDSGSAGARTYEWVFEDAALRFVVAITWSASGTSTATTPESGTADVVRGPRDELAGHG